MNIRNNIIRYFVSLGVFIIIDIPWILFVVNPMYEKNLGPVLRNELSLLPAVAFYLIIIAALQMFTTGVSTTKATINAFVLGIVGYATYTLTNMSIIQGWSWEMVFTDMLWGGVLMVLTFQATRLLVMSVKSEL